MRVSKETKMLILLFALITINLIPVWAFHYLPLTDYPNHLARIKIMKDYLLNEESIYHNYFYINTLPIPNFISDALMLLFSNFFSIYTSGKLALSAFIVLFPLSILYFSRSIGSKSYVSAFFALSYVFNLFFNMGFLNFIISLPVFFFALGYWWRKRDALNLSSFLFLCLLSLLLYFSHFFSFAVFSLSITVLSFLERINIKQLIKRLLPLLPPLLLSVIFLSSVFSQYTDIFGKTIRPFDFPSFLKELVKLMMVKIGSLFISGPTPFIIVAVIFIVAILDLYAVQRGYATHRVLGIAAFLPSSKPLLLLSLILFGAYCLAPPALLGWYFVYMRFIPFFLFTFLATLSVPKKLDKYLLLIPLLLSIFVMLHTHTVYAGAEPTLKALLSGANLIEDNSKLFPFLTQHTLWCPTNEGANLCHAWSYYLIETNNSVGPKLFSSIYHPLRYRHTLPGETDVVEFIKAKPASFRNDLPYCGEASCAWWVEYYHSSNFSALAYYDYLILLGNSCNASAYIPPEFYLYHTNDSFYTFHIYKNSKK